MDRACHREVYKTPILAEIDMFLFQGRGLISHIIFLPATYTNSWLKHRSQKIKFKAFLSNSFLCFMNIPGLRRDPLGHILIFLKSSCLDFPEKQLFS